MLLASAALAAEPEGPAEAEAGSGGVLEALQAKVAALEQRSRIDVRAYVQPQLVFDQQSEDALDPDGEPLNLDRFRIRRARLELSRTSDHLFAGLEIDANTMERTSISLAGAEVAAMVPGPPGQPPLARLGLGMDRLPFGFELLQTIRERPFAERTLGSRAFFPGDSDMGAKLSGAVGPARYAVAVVNGVPIGPDSDATVFAHQKTAVGRVGVESAVGADPAVRAGVSFLKGTGFHPGTPTSKATFQWLDTNQDGIVTLNELVGVPAQASTPSATFPRWGVNADAGVSFRTVLGRTELGAEITLAANLDRGFLPADPIATGYTLRELAWSGFALQELSENGLVGLRIDEYTPTADLFDYRHAEYLSVDTSVLTVTGLGGVKLPGRASLYLQYDYVVDLLGVDARGEPVDLPNDVWTLASQVEL